MNDTRARTSSLDALVDELSTALTETLASADSLRSTQRESLSLSGTETEVIRERLTALQRKQSKNLAELAGLIADIESLAAGEPDAID